MDNQIRQLAETLKKTGMAASMSEAIEKAKSILNIKTTQEENQNTFQNIGVDVKQDATLNELMREVNVTPEQVEVQKQEKIEDIKKEVFVIKKDIREAEKNPEKVELIKKEVEKVKDEINKITEDIPKEKEEDMFKEEKKIDLNKLFGNNK